MPSYTQLDMPLRVRCVQPTNAHLPDKMGRLATRDQRVFCRAPKVAPLSVHHALVVIDVSRMENLQKSLAGLSAFLRLE